MTLMGEIVSDISFSHEIGEKRFYKTDIRCDRLSENSDTVPIIIPEEQAVNINRGDLVYLRGQIRTCNRTEGDKSKLLVYVYAKEIDPAEEHEDNSREANLVYLDGYLCRKPTYRKTPLGREISDLFLAVNRPNGKTDYIPCICWGKKAVGASEYEVGDRLILSGRFQSREYMKKIDEENVEKRIAYEVSVYTVRKVTERTAALA